MLSQLTIHHVQCTPVNVPLMNPIKTASGNVTHAPIILIDLTTEEGIEGRGYLFTYTPLVLTSVYGLMNELAELLKGVTCSPHEVEKMLNNKFRLLGNTGLVTMAIAGIDMAMWDALAKSASLPLSTLLGGKPKPIPAYFSQGLDGLKRGVELAEECVNKGFKLMKIKVGYPTIEKDVEVIKAVQSVLGEQAKLAVDYNQSLSVPEAMLRCHVLDELNLVWIEEPTRQEDIQGHARITNVTATPVMIGENWYGTHEMARSIAANASDMVMPDLMKIGGVSGWLRASTLAKEFGLPMSSHLFQEVSSHLMCVTPTAHYLEILELANPILASPLEIVDGNAMPSHEPGNGLAWEKDAVAQYSAL